MQKGTTLYINSDIECAKFRSLCPGPLPVEVMERPFRQLGMPKTGVEKTEAK
jgi:hypothetical protein